MKRILINTIGWTLYENGDCVSDYSVYYNIFSKKSNLIVFPKSILKELNKHFTKE